MKHGQETIRSSAARAAEILSMFNDDLGKVVADRLGGLVSQLIPDYEERTEYIREFIKITGGESHE